MVGRIHGKAGDNCRTVVALPLHPDLNPLGKRSLARLVYFDNARIHAATDQAPVMVTTVPGK